MRVWILVLAMTALLLCLDVGAKVKQPKVDKKAQKKGHKKQKEEPAKAPKVKTAPESVPQAPPASPPVPKQEDPPKPTEPKLVQLKEAQSEQQYWRERAELAEQRAAYAAGRADEAQKLAAGSTTQSQQEPPQAPKDEGLRQGYPYPPNGNGNGNGNGAPHPAVPLQGQEQGSQEPVFIPDLAKIKFLKPKHHHHHGHKHDHRQQPYRNCGCATGAQPGAEKPAQAGPDPRIADVLNDPDYMYLKMVPAEELPEEGSPEAECPILVISRKDEHLARGCLRVLKQQVDEAVAQYEAERRYSQAQNMEDDDEDPEDDGTGSLLGDVKQAVRRAVDRRSGDDTDQAATGQAEGTNNPAEETEPEPAPGGPRSPNSLPPREKPKKILEANKDLENEPIGANGYEGIGSI